MDMSLSKLQELVMDREACLFALHAIKYSWPMRRHWRPHSSTLAWKIPWVEESGRLQSMGLRKVRGLSDFTFTFHFHFSLSLFTFTFNFHALEKEMATRSSVLAWRIPGMGAWWTAVYGIT